MSNSYSRTNKPPETLKDFISDFNQRKVYIANIVDKFKQVENTTNQKLSSIYWDTEKDKDFEFDLKNKSNECNKVVKNMSDCAQRFFVETWESEQLKDVKRKSKFFKTCKNKFCAVCCKIRSNKMFHQTYDVIKEIKEQEINYVPYHLTLTIKNPTYEQFDAYYKIMNDALMRMVDKTQRDSTLQMKKHLLGWQAGREVTQGVDAKESGTLHPHIHMLLLLDPEVQQTSITLLKRQIKKEWNYCLRKQKSDFPYASQVSLEQIKVSDKTIDIIDNEAIAIAEVSKYPTKPADLVTMDSDVLVNLYISLKNKRIITFGGLMKDVRAYLKLDDDKVEDSFILEEFYQLKSVHLYNYFNNKYNKQNIKKKDLLQFRVISNSLLIEYQHSKDKHKVENDYNSISDYLRLDYSDINQYECIKKYGDDEVINPSDTKKIFALINSLAERDRKEAFDLKEFRKNVGPLLP